MYRKQNTTTTTKKMLLGHALITKPCFLKNVIRKLFFFQKKELSNKAIYAVFSALNIELKSLQFSR